MFTESGLEAALASLPFGGPLHFFASIGSTNDEARRLAQAGTPQGTLVVADEQTNGRGRAGRTWITPRGTAIAASYVLRPDLPAERVGVLSLLGGLAAALAIEAVTPLRTQLKWPNDVWVDGRKVCGVLAESSQSVRAGRPPVDWVVLGIGINANGAPPAGAQLRYPATTLAEATGAAVDRVALLVALARMLSELYRDLNMEHIAAEWNARLLWGGRRVRIDVGQEIVTGILQRVNAEGALVLRLESGASHVTSVGEISPA